MGAKWWKKISKSSSEYGVGKKNFKKKPNLKNHLSTCNLLI
jgi:hypothetical protein